MVHTWISKGIPSSPAATLCFSNFLFCFVQIIIPSSRLLSRNIQYWTGTKLGTGGQVLAMPFLAALLAKRKRSDTLSAVKDEGSSKCLPTCITANLTTLPYDYRTSRTEKDSPSNEETKFLLEEHIEREVEGISSSITTMTVIQMLTAGHLLSCKRFSFHRPFNLSISKALAT